MIFDFCIFWLILYFFMVMQIFVCWIFLIRNCEFILTSTVHEYDTSNGTQSNAISSKGIHQNIIHQKNRFTKFRSITTEIDVDQFFFGSNGIIGNVLLRTLFPSHATSSESPLADLVNDFDSIWWPWVTDIDCGGFGDDFAADGRCWFRSIVHWAYSSSSIASVNETVRRRLDSLLCHSEKKKELKNF